MKPCLSNRKLIVWLVMDALDAERTRRLRVHLETCPGCRHYLDEMAAVRQHLEKRTPAPNLEASPVFRRRWLHAVRAARRSPLREDLAALVRNWRVALPLTAVAALAILAIAPFGRLPESPATIPPEPQAPAPQTFKTDLPPTLANYQMAAGYSLEAFDDLLLRQGNRNLPPVPRFGDSELLPEALE